LLERAALIKTLVSSTQSVWGTQQLVELVRGEPCGFGQSHALLESVLQTVRVKRAHGFVVFGRHQDTHHPVVLQHLHRLSLGGVEELAELGFGLVGCEALHVFSLARIVRFERIIESC
jgi:hypothetical protein